MLTNPWTLWAFCSGVSSGSPPLIVWKAFIELGCLLKEWRQIVLEAYVYRRGNEPFYMPKC